MAQVTVKICFNKPLFQELYKDDGSKYDMSLKGDTYTLTVFNPVVADSGRYTLVVKLEKDTQLYCSGNLTVKGNQKRAILFLRIV